MTKTFSLHSSADECNKTLKKMKKVFNAKMKLNTPTITIHYKVLYDTKAQLDSFLSYTSILQKESVWTITQLFTIKCALICHVLIPAVYCDVL